MKKHTHTPQGFKEEDYTDEDNAQYLKDKEGYDKAVADKKAYEDLKASAKAKLVSGKALTEAEANTIVL